MNEILEWLREQIRQVQPPHSAWGLFGVRWAFVAGLAAFVMLGPGTVSDDVLVPVVIISASVVLLNLLLVLLIVLETWIPGVPLLLISIDLLLAGAAVVYTDIRLAWLLMIPLGIAGLYVRNWFVLLVTGIATAAILMGLELFGTQSSNLTVQTLLMILIGYPSVGPLVFLLTEERGSAGRQRGLRRQRRSDEGRGDTQAVEAVSVIHEMAEVLSTSKLSPARVLSAAVTFGIEGLERLGVKPPMFSIILLFDAPGEGMEPVLRPVRASAGVSSHDQQTTIPGDSGAVGRTINNIEASTSTNPAGDPELSQFECMRGSKTVMCLPLYSGKEAYGVMLVGAYSQRTFSQLHIALMNAIANQTSASLNNAQLYASLREQRDRIVEVEKNARAQLAADLHDGPTQGASAVTMRLNYVRKLIERDLDQTKEELYQIEELARSTTKEIRAMLFTLRPKALEQGLGPALKHLGTQAKDTYDQNLQVSVEEGCDQLLDEQSAQTLFSIASEALNNARKHAEADVIEINVRKGNKQFVMEIRDDGKGFNVEEAVAEAQEREGHLGLINLYERAALIDATFDIQSTPGEGTQMTVSIPLEVLQQKKEQEQTSPI